MKIKLHLLLTLGVSIFFSSFAFSEERPLEPEDATMRDATVYMEDFGVSYRKAKFRLGIQSLIGEFEEKIKKKEGRDFAGLYIQHKPRYRIKVLYKKRKHHRHYRGHRCKHRRHHGHHKNFRHTVHKLLHKKKFRKLRRFVRVKKAKNTMSDLEALQLTVLNLVNTVNILADTSVDIIKNKVELAVTSIDDLNNALTDNGLSLPNGVNLIEVNQLISIESIYGGLPISTCTVGFGVKNSSGTKGIVTAAHCSNTQKHDGVSLPFQTEVLSGSTDMQWHTAPNITVENDVRTSSFFGVTTTWRNITGTVSRSAQSVGSVVCKYGKTTGYGCGTILSKSVMPSADVQNPNATFVSVSDNGSTLTAGGDSGGPWFSGNNAYGVHQAGNKSTISVYTPINYLSNLGLTILTN